MFGATLAGGSQACPPYTFPGCGTLYKLTRSGGGRWCHRVLFAFPGTDGADPGAPLVADSAGNLYGTTEIGGAYSVGTVFELTRTKRGCWHRRVLYSFKGAPDGASPEANLIFDGAGALYGTTLIGGTGSCNGGGFQNSCGTVFKLTPQPGGNWTETVLYSFSGGDDGGWPMAGLVLDSFGNLYGTTSSYGTTNCGQGNQVGCGTLFELSPRSEGRWTETTLHDFTGQPNDGGFPEGGLVLDGSGNLYGTTTIGGSSDQGSVFELSPGSNGQWTEALLYNFTGDSAGAYPLGNLIFDRFGNLYGVALIGGAGQCYGRGCGAVFELSPGQGGSWTVITIYDFTGYPNDGYYPVGGLTVDQAGNLYGATQYGGTFSEACGLGCGTVFELTPAGRGSWNENVLYRFNSNDGSNPTGVIRDPTGNLYGATYYGGTADDGVVFRESTARR